MALDSTLTLPCDTTTQICNCTRNMDYIMMNSSEFTGANLYKCGFFNGLNFNDIYKTTFTTYNEAPNANITGWDCGKGEDKIYGYSNDFDLLSLYRCGYNRGKQQGEKIKRNQGNKTVGNTKLWTVLMILLFLCFTS